MQMFGRGSKMGLSRGSVRTRTNAFWLTLLPTSGFTPTTMQGLKNGSKADEKHVEPCVKSSCSLAVWKAARASSMRCAQHVRHGGPNRHGDFQIHCAAAAHFLTAGRGLVHHRSLRLSALSLRSGGCEARIGDDLHRFGLRLGFHIGHVGVLEDEEQDQANDGQQHHAADDHPQPWEGRRRFGFLRAGTLNVTTCAWSA